MTVGLLSFALSGLGNTNRVTLNAVSGAGWINFAKGFVWPIDPTIANSDGYPSGTISSAWTCNPTLDPNYYGQYLIKWSGTSSIQFPGPPCIIYSGGAFVSGVSPASSGDIAFNFGIFGQTNARVLFAFGVNIQSITNSTVSNGLGGTKIRIGTKTGFAGNLSTGQIMNVSGILTQTNANGTWAITQIDAQTFDLEGSTWNAGQGTSGVVGQAILQAANLSVNLPAGSGYSGFSNLVVCRSGDEAAVDAGQINDPVLVAQYQYLMGTSTSGANAGYLRFMDASAVQGSFECDFANRMPKTYINYNNNNYYAPAYLTTSASGAITRGGTDAYTCADATQSVLSAGQYIDCAVIQGKVSATNTGNFPTLAVGTGPAAPVFGFTPPLPYYIQLNSAPASAGLSMVFTFTASWLNSGVAYAFTYTTVAGDVGNLPNFYLNLYNALLADSVLTTVGKIGWVNGGTSGFLQVYPRTAQAGALTLAYTSGPAIVTLARLFPSQMDATKFSTFIYNQMVGGWIYLPQGLVISQPFEQMVELCNLTKTNCWFNWPLYTKGQFITDVTNFFGDATTGLTSGYRFATEVGNEPWNSGAQIAIRTDVFGACLNLVTNGVVNSNEAPNWSYTALRTIQYGVLSRAAWAGKGRAAGDHYLLLMGRSAEASTPGQNYDTYGLQSSLLTTSNSIYSSYGGLGGGAGTSYTAAGSRAVDVIDASGMACYWFSDWLQGGNQVAFIEGTVAQNAPWLQAALDYANGLTATAYTSMVNQTTGATVRSGGPPPDYFGGQNFGVFATTFSGFESMIAAYDASRISAGKKVVGILHYEGGPQWAVGDNLNTGTNGTGSFWYTPLANHITSLGWNVSAYTVSGTNSATECANQVVNLIQAWKQDVSYKNMIKASYYQALVSASGSHRETKPAQFGYYSTTWGLFADFYTSTNRYTNYDAIHEFNA